MRKGGGEGDTRLLLAQEPKFLSSFRRRWRKDVFGKKRVKGGKF